MPLWVVAGVYCRRGWITTSDGSKKDKDQEIAALLNAEIEKAFEDAKKIVNKMDVAAIPKGIIYDLLHKEEFLVAVGKMIPAMKSLHTEFLGVVREKPVQANLFPAVK